MAIIYRKTASGIDEIETRERRLSPRVRSALILVDGRRSLEELAGLVQQCDEMLKTLLTAGLIEMVRAPARPGPGAPEDPPAEAARQRSSPPGS